MPKRTLQSSLRKTLVKQDKAIRRELRTEMQQTAQDMAAWLTIAVRGWKRKPRFAPRTEITPDHMRAFVDVAGTAKKIFVYVDKGTGKYGPKKRAYQIPKHVVPGGKLLRFQKGYSPKTAPVAQINVGTGKHFGGWVSKVKVIHPGIKPRKFSETVAKELKPSFDKRIERAFRRGIARVK